MHMGAECQIQNGPPQTKRLRLLSLESHDFSLNKDGTWVMFRD